MPRRDSRRGDWSRAGASGKIVATGQQQEIAFMSPGFAVLIRLEGCGRLRQTRYFPAALRLAVLARRVLNGQAHR